MQTQMHFSHAQQLELSERILAVSDRLPRERPTCDPELEVMFLRAASAWAKWRERQRWSAR
jgi:hypothetical protein